jgi:hypothetical protein
MQGRVCPVEDILSRQPDLRVLRDPPTLVGRRIRYVLLFHLEPESTGVRRCKVRAYAWTDPAFFSRLEMMDKRMSTVLSETIYRVAKNDFQHANPNEMRSRGQNISRQAPF